MELKTVLAVLLFVPFSFFAHTLLHECAHAVVGLMQGAKVLRLSIVPKKINGGWLFGHTAFDRPLSKATSYAPLGTEFVWFWLATLIRINCDLSAPLEAILFVEVVASLVDMTAWWLGCWTGKVYTDGARTAGTDTEAKVASAIMMVPLYWITFMFNF